jgi:hypothetical protein
MADFIPSVIGGALGRMIGSAVEPSLAPASGLSAASAREEVKPITMPETPEGAIKDYYTELNNLRRVQNDLLRSLEERAAPNARDTLFAISRGLLAPNPTGQFGAAFGNAVGEMQGQQERQNAAAQQLAKMRLEMVQSQINQRKQSVGMALANKMLGIGGERPTGTEGSTLPSASLSDSTQASAASANAPMRNITGADITRLAMFDPDMAKAIKEGLAIDQDRYAVAQNGAVFDKRNGTYLDIPIPGQTQSEYTIGGKTYRMTPNEYSQYRLKAAIGKNEGDRYLANLLSGTGAVDITTPSVSEAKVEEERRITEAKERAKADAARREQLIASADFAPRFDTLAQSNMQLITENPDAVGVLATPGVSSAVLGMLSKVRANASSTRAGGVSTEADMGEIEKAIIKFGPKKLPTETPAQYKDRVQRNIDAANMIVRNLSEMELYAAKSFLKGQGSVSNMERNITKALGGNISDSRIALMAKSEMTSITSKYDQRIRDDLFEWETKNPGLSTERFMSSNEYKKAISAYNDELKSLNNRYFGSKRSGSAPSTAAPSSQSSELQQLRDNLRRELGVQ